MDRDRVIAILESLANGFDPNSGARLPTDVFQTAETVRALFTASALLKITATVVAASPKRRTTLTSAGLPWTDDEDTRLCQEFDAKMTISQIALQHSRSSGAITSRLVKLGRIDPATVKSRDRGARASSTGSLTRRDPSPSG
jgi:hypothetical protein